MLPRLPSTIILLLFTALNVVADDFECGVDNLILGQKYDLTSLKVSKTVERTRNTPPTTMTDSIRFNICAELEQSSLPANDQCPSGSRACLTKTNKKDGESDRIIAVIPLATKSALNPSYQALSASDRQGVSLLLHGEAYPAGGAEQTLNITLFCSTENQEPNFVSYDNNVAVVEWAVPAACAKTADDPKTPDAEVPIPPSSSGVGWFFLLLFVSLGAYFAVGAYHNYTTYGASGWDLVPHRYFWAEVPYLFKDLGQHLINAFRSPTRGGYQSV